MRILHVIATAELEGGGPIEGVGRLGEQFLARGHMQELLTLDPPDAPYLAQVDRKVHALGRPQPRGGGPLARFRRWTHYTPEAVDWLRAHVRDYDLVIVNGLWNYSTHLARRVLPTSGVPYIVYSHGMLDPWFRRTYPIKHAAKQLLWLVNEGVLLRHADAVAFTCEQERVLARTSFWPWRANERVVAYGTAAPPPPSAAAEAAFRALVPSLPAGRPYLLFLSRIHEKKGCDLLIQAFAAVAGTYPEIDLVIAGPDQVGLQSRLTAQADAAGIGARIHWPGMVKGDAKWGAFHGCEAFVLPSHQENFGIVVAEALACGKPALISDQVNIWQEIVAGGAGLVAPDTAAGTEAMLRRFLALPDADRRAMGKRGRTVFAEKFTIEAAARDVIRLAETLIAHAA